MQNFYNILTIVLSEDIFKDAKEWMIKKEIWLMLKSDERCYYVQASVDRREDVFMAYKAMNLIGINHGYACEFLTLKRDI